jgi:transposase-like protein
MDSCSGAERDRIRWSGNLRTLPSELALREGPRRCWDTVAIVWPCLLGVDAYAAAGRGVKVPRPSCPRCERPMGFWPGYLRWVRYGRARRIWVRRATCRGCRVSHALLPAFVLARRLDAVEAIGAGLAWAVGGRGMRPIAAWLGVPHSTARDWRRRFRARAPTLAAGLAALAVELTGSVPALPIDCEAAALVALGAVWAWVAGGWGRPRRACGGWAR